MSRYDLLILGGTVGNPDGSSVADVAVRDGVVAAVGTPGTLGRDADRVIDATGRFVVPGGVDPHVHTALASGGTVTRDGFFESTRAAAFGGTTTIVDFAIPAWGGVEGPLDVARRLAEEAASQIAVDVTFHGCVTKFDDTTPGQIAALSAKGMATLKLFTIYRDAFMLELGEIHRCMQAVAAADGVVLVHCESPHLIEPLVDDCARAGRLDAAAHAMTRPPVAEADMVRSVIELLRLTGARGYIVHVSTPEALLDINRARASGVRVWAETCPQYVFLEDSVYSGADAELYICSPPIRSEEYRAQLWRLLQDGLVSLWGSDHCCYDRAQKRAGRGDFRLVPNGLPGVETRCPLLFARGVMTGVLDLAAFVRLTATNPARLNGLYPRKGVLWPGSDADFAIYDPKVSSTLAASQLHMATDYTPFEGFAMHGWPAQVIHSGTVIVDEGVFHASPGAGRVLSASNPCSPVGR